MPLECHYCHKPLYSLAEQHAEADCIAWLKQQERLDRERHAKARKAEQPPALPNERSTKLSDK